LSAVPNPDPANRRTGAVPLSPLSSPVRPVGYVPPVPTYRKVGESHSVLVN